MQGSDEAPILTVEHVTKSFGGVQAMRDGSFDLKRGEVVAIVGGNGAGKSTLAKIVSGAHVPDSGRITIKGVEVTRADHSVSHMQDRGIEVVYQDLALVPNMTAPYNLFLGRIPRKWGLFVDEKKMREKTREVLEQLNVTTVQDLDPPEILRVDLGRPQGDDGPIEIVVEARDKSGLRQAAPFVISVDGDEREGFLRCDAASGLCRASLPPEPGALELVELIVEDYAGNAAFE